MPFKIGDIVEVKTERSWLEHWDGLIGEIEEQFSWGGWGIRFPDKVPGEPHKHDPYILLLTSSSLRLVSTPEIVWEV